LSWRPFVKRWLSTFFEDKDPEVITEAVKDQLDMLFEATLDDGLDYLRDHLPPEPIKTTDLQLVTSMVNLIEYFLDPEKGFKGTDDEKKKITEQIFAWCYTWGLGASLTTAGKDRFDPKIRDLFKAAQIPPGNTVFDYFYDMKPKEKTFKAWSTKVANFEYDKDASFFDLMVPTADTTKHDFVL
jgi:dynein heavy chain